MADNSGLNLYDSTIEYVKKRKERIEEGLINVIPSPFKRFSENFIGLEPATYYLITSYTKGGKSQFVSNLLFEALYYCYSNPECKASVRVLYFPLEETSQRITIRMFSWLLMKKYNVRVSPSTLRSVNKKHLLRPDILKILEDDEFKKISEYFLDHIIFYSDKNPTGIHKSCVQYAASHGQILRKKVEYSNEEVKDKYIPNDPNEYVFVLIDTVNLVNKEKDLYSKKEAIDKLSRDYLIELRNFYGFSPIVIQQQNTDNENIESVKLGRTRPSIAGLGDSKYTGQDCNIALGIFSPFKFGLDSYLKDINGSSYDIRLLKDHFRTLEVLINRDGETGGIIGLFFDGATTTWKEMPLPSDAAGINKAYDFIKNLNSFSD